MSLHDDFPEICRRDVCLGPLTWFGLGGPVDHLVEPRTKAELVAVVRRARELNLPVRILGMGANVLVPDEGVRGVVIRLTGPDFVGVSYDGNTITAGGGADLTHVVRHTVRRGLAGLEVLAGIPGTVGGGIRMNCGGRYGEISTALVSVRVIGSDGELYERERDDLEFGYRRCNIRQEFITSATFRLCECDRDELRRYFREIWMYKQNTQPPMGAPSAGCIFRNPNGQSAGALIDRAGLKGLRHGSAWVSDRHANFVCAERGGRAADVRALIDMITQRVQTEFGIMLEPEVMIW